jgi:ribose-phosphate pyrophosphokinase
MFEKEIQNAKFFSSKAGMHYATEVMNFLGKDLSPLHVSSFSCGELYVKYKESIRGRHVFIFHSIRPESTNNDFIELFLLCNAAKQSFAQSVHVVLPHFGYARQDKIHDAREPISAKLMANLITTSGANHVITLHLHSYQIQGFFDIPVDNVSMRKQFVSYFKEKTNEDFLIVSPDVGGAKYAKQFADDLGVDLAILHKTRPAHNEAEITEVVGNIKGKTCILVDDMVDTGGSVCVAKKALLNNGANESIYLCATHPIFSGNAISRLKDAKFKEIIVSDSIPLAENSLPIKVISSASLFAKIIESILYQKSVSVLF